MTHETLTGTLIVVRSGEPIYSESATKVSIDDGGAGLFVRVTQSGKADAKGIVTIDPDEWPALREAIDRMIAACARAD